MAFIREQAIEAIILAFRGRDVQDFAAQPGDS